MLLWEVKEEIPDLLMLNPYTPQTIITHLKVNATFMSSAEHWAVQTCHGMLKHNTKLFSKNTVISWHQQLTSQNKTLEVSHKQFGFLPELCCLLSCTQLLQVCNYLQVFVNKERLHIHLKCEPFDFSS